MFNTFKLKMQISALKKENKALRTELEQKNTIIKYLNGCVNKANQRYVDILNRYGFIKSCESLNFPNSEEPPGQISISDILEN